MIGKTIRLGPRTATVVGVLEPSVPYPADTEIIANVVTSPHHLGATMVTERTHRMTELFGRLAPGASLEEARAELTAAHAAMMRAAPRGVFGRARGRPAERHAAPRSDRRAGADDPARAARRRGGRLRHRVLERRQPDPGAHRCAARASWRCAPRSAPATARCGGRCSPRAWCSAAPAPCSACCWRGRSWRVVAATPRASRCARSTSRSTPACSGSAPAWRWPRPCCSRTSRGCRRRTAPAGLGLASGSLRITPGTNRRLRVFADDPDRVLVRAARRRGHAARHARRAADGEHRLRHAAGAGLRHPARPATASATRRRSTSIRRRRGASRSCRASRASPSGASCRGATPAPSARAFPFTAEGYTPADGEEDPRARLRIVAPRLLRRARRPAARRPRLHRRRPPRQRAGGDREPERRAAAVPERRRARTGTCGGPIRYFGKPAAAPHRRRRRGRGRRERRARAGADGLSPGPADAASAGRLFVHATGDPYALVPAGDAGHPRDVARTSRWSAPRRSRTCARRCCRPSG